jgi:altronate dehydratase
MTSGFIRLHAADNVVIALADLRAGDLVEGVALTGAVPRGHKIAMADLVKGAAVLRYGQTIGQALVDIPAGSHVHSHNLGMGPHSTDYAIGAEATPLPALPVREFMGYHRADGQVGELFGFRRALYCRGGRA